MEIHIAVSEDRERGKVDATSWKYDCGWAVSMENQGRRRTQAGYMNDNNIWNATMRGLKAACGMLAAGTETGEVKIHLSVAGNYLPQMARSMAEGTAPAGRHPELVQLVRELTQLSPGVEFAEASHLTMTHPGWQAAKGAAEAALVMKETPRRGRGPSLGELAPGPWLAELELESGDGPKMALKRDAGGYWYLAWPMGRQGELGQWLHLPATIGRLERILPGRIELRKAFEDPEGGFLLSVCETGSGPPCSRAVVPGDLDPGALPPRRAMLDVPVPNELYDL